MESHSASIEETYFWILNYLQYDMGLSHIHKITDVFTASENSTFFGVVQQRIGLQQDKVAQYLGTIGKLIKDMFQIVRELRIIDERLEIYYKSKKMDGFEYDNQEWEKERSHDTEDHHEITVKGLYVDMAEGGSKNPSSVFGMAQQLQYTVLPDLFFSIHPKNDKDIGQMVDNLDFNKNVKWVLKRKLSTYFKWKKHTYLEMLNRKKFTVKYLRQHYQSIRTYIAWIKPYMKNLRRLQMNHKNSDEADLISAFESSILEIEVLATSKAKGCKDVFSCIDLYFRYRTSPQMNYTGEGYQRAPLHLGKIEIQMRTYAWTKDEIDEYKKMREMEDLDMIADVETSLRDAMDALGDDMEKYLAEAGEWKMGNKKPKEERSIIMEPKLPGMADPFISLIDSFASPFKALAKKPEAKPGEDKFASQREKALGAAVFPMWLTYKNYKKAHRMLTW